MDLKDYAAIIFDLDGTVLNSSKDVMLCLGDAFEKENLEIDKTKLNPNIIGPPLNKMVKAVLPGIDDEMNLRVVSNYNEIYDSGKYNNTKLYDGIYELLVRLKSANKKLFLATNKPNISTHLLIKKYDLSMFDDVYAFDMYGKELLTKTQMVKEIIEKYNLDIKKTVMIGDSPGDVLAAKNNGIKSIGALWGYGDNKQPLIENADIVANNAKDLAAIL